MPHVIPRIHISTTLAQLVRNYLKRPRTQRTLDSARDDILLGNDYAYEERLKETVCGILAKVQAVLGPDCAVVSFHFSSIALRRWLRITPPDTWKSTIYSGTERDYFVDIYDWDARSGHIMTDPDMPDSLQAVLGGAGPDLITIDGTPCKLQVSKNTWNRALDIVQGKAFPLLVKHDLDHCKDKTSIGAEVKRLRSCLNKTQRDRFAESIEAIGRLALGFWPTARTRPTVVVAARSFLLSFYFTIGRAPKHIPGVPFEQIVTCSVSPLHCTANVFGKEKTGAIAAVFRTRTGALVALQPGDMQQATDELVRALVELEHRALFERVHDTITSIGEEDLIRRACDVDIAEGNTTEVPQDRIASLTLPLHQTIAELLVERRFSPDEENSLQRQEAQRELRKHNHRELVRRLTAHLGGELDETIRSLVLDFQMVGASHVYRQLLRDLAALVTADDLTKTRVVFLDSEPGCGKETLTQLIHLFSGRAHLDILLNKKARSPDQAKAALRKARKRLGDVFASSAIQEQWLSDLPAAFVKKEGQKNPPNVHEVTTHSIPRKQDPSFQKYGTCRLFNYFTVNMATLHDAECFTERLFGRFANKKLEKVGRCFLAHALSGTLFFDEFNTLPVREQANCFLRLLDKPNEMDIGGRPGGPIRNVNMLSIFASNKTREGLIEAGFNEAVVYRVTKTRIRIPPLRERPVDIAVFVNAAVRDYNKRMVKAKNQGGQIHHIDLPAMRLLCELSWPDNYRGVAGLMDDILGDRLRRKIRHKVLTFEDILKGLRKREAFQAAVSLGQSESVERSSKR